MQRASRAIVVFTLIALGSAAQAGQHEIDPAAWKGSTPQQVMAALGPPIKVKTEQGETTLVYDFPPEVPLSPGSIALAPPVTSRWPGAGSLEPLQWQWQREGAEARAKITRTTLRFRFDRDRGLDRVLSNRRPGPATLVPDFSTPLPGG